MLFVTQVDELIKDNREMLQGKLRLLKAENNKFMQALESTRINQDLIGQKLIESQREAKGVPYHKLISSLAEEIERG